MSAIDSILEQLTSEYVELHTRKEDLFWVTKMGLAEDMAAARQSYTGAEQAWHAFLQDPARLAGLRRLEPEARAAPDSQRRALAGWIAMFSAHVIESPDGRRLSAELVELEGELDRQRRAMPLGYVDPATGRLERASSVQLALMLRSDPDEARRKAAGKPAAVPVAPPSSSDSVSKTAAKSTTESTASKSAKKPASKATAEAAAGTCGHRSMNGRTCTREAGHSEKSHRYN